MPNWCSTSIFFYSKDKDIVQDLKNKLEKIYNAPSTVENDFKKGWLGDFVNTLLAPDYHTSKEKCPDCRGSICTPPDYWGFENVKDFWYFCIQTETAWAPMLKMWSLIVKKHYKNKIKIAFEAEECGNEVYRKCDPDGLFDFERYYIEYSLADDCDSERIDSLDYVIDYIAEIKTLGITKEQLRGKTAAEIEQIANDAAVALSEDNYFAVHEFRDSTIAQASQE